MLSRSQKSFLAVGLTLVACKPVGQLTSGEKKSAEQTSQLLGSCTQTGSRSTSGWHYCNEMYGPPDQQADQERLCEVSNRMMEKNARRDSTEGSGWSQRGCTNDDVAVICQSPDQRVIRYYYGDREDGMPRTECPGRWQDITNDKLGSTAESVRRNGARGRRDARDSAKTLGSARKRLGSASQSFSRQDLRCYRVRQYRKWAVIGYYDGVVAHYFSSHAWRSAKNLCAKVCGSKWRLPNADQLIHFITKSDPDSASNHSITSEEGESVSKWGDTYWLQKRGKKLYKLPVYEDDFANSMTDNYRARKADEDDELQIFCTR